MTDPGPLIGKGRAADIYDVGDGLVLRRTRSGRSVETAAAVMRHLHAHGFPVPRVDHAEGPDLVMERVDAPSMLAEFGRRPWQVRRLARTLADLHGRLAHVPVPDLGLDERFGPPTSLLHGDFHPDNVLLTDAGPVVIDWDNVGLGPAAADVAHTWLIVASSEVEGNRPLRMLQEAGRAGFVRAFLDRAGRDDARRWLRAVGEHRLADRNVRPGEAAAVRRIVAAESR